MSDWRFEWVTSWDEVWTGSFEAAWRRWMAESRSAHVFFEPAVVRAWTEAYREVRRIEPRFVVGRGPSGETAFLPLVLDRGKWKDCWRRALVPAGWGEFDVQDPILVSGDERDCWEGFWKGLTGELERRWRSTFDWFSMPRTTAPVDGSMEVADEAPFLELRGIRSAEELVKGRSAKKHQSALRSQLGTTVLDVLPRDASAEECGAFLREFLGNHARRWPGAGTPRSYYFLLAKYAVPEGILTLNRLKCGGTPVSWRLSFLHKRTSVIYVQAFAAGAGHYSPGVIHFLHLVNWSVERGCTRLDFGRGKEDWKMRWTDNTYPLYGTSRAAAGVRASMTERWHQTVRPALVGLKRFLTRA
ncbi:MAG: GNAT family N-acetyltransferase [Acidobacteriota bacterium]